MYSEVEFWVALVGATILCSIVLVSGVRLALAHGSLGETAVGTVLVAFAAGILTFLGWGTYNIVV